MYKSRGHEDYSLYGMLVLIAQVHYLGVSMMQIMRSIVFALPVLYSRTIIRKRI
jgi:hypothetical protein